MASFVGTPKEFRRFIGPRLRNLVNLLTRQHRISLANCNHCGATERLESAHVHGRGRNQIIHTLLAQYTNDNIVTVDIVVFEELFKTEHDPIEKSILVLCRSCHSKYDAPLAEDSTRNIDLPSVEAGLISYNRREQLPIDLLPSDPVLFKQELLRTRLAEIITTYLDGRVESRVWNAQNFSAESNVFGNLRSRPEFRQGTWQSKGIEKVTVRVTHKQHESRLA